MHAGYPKSRGTWVPRDDHARGMSEFLDLAQLIVDCSVDGEPLPLDVAVAIANGGLEQLWARSREHEPMSMMLKLLHHPAPLPTAVAVRVAKRAVDRLPSRARSYLENERIQAALRELETLSAAPHSRDRWVALEREIEILASCARPSECTEAHTAAWDAVSVAMRAVGHPEERLPEFGADPVLAVVDYASEAEVPTAWLAAELRPFGPPSLEQIVAGIESARPI